MKGVLDQFAHSFFHKQSWEEVALSDLKAFAGQHPYFSGGQVLLALKAKEESSAETEALASKASLFVSNALALDLLTRSEQFQTRPKSVLVTKEEPSLTFPQPSSEEEETLEEEIEIEVPVLAEEENEAIRLVLDREMEIAEKEGSLELAPQHTVDYFASQGIKDKPELPGNDRFSQQLRSFTDWLKTLKKLTPEQPVPVSADPLDEEAVTHLAADSLQEKEVVTEAMAEIWAKQGDTARALAIYQKLSLLNPAKSAYFASLIDKLNASK